MAKPRTPPSGSGARTAGTRRLGLWLFGLLCASGLAGILLVPEGAELPGLSRTAPASAARPDPLPPPFEASSPAQPGADDAERVDRAQARQLFAAAFGARRAGSRFESRAAALAQALDPSAPLAERVRALRALAGAASPAELHALEALLDPAQAPELRAAAAEVLARALGPDSLEKLESLLRSPDLEIARGALRGLGARASSPAPAAALGEILLSGQLPLVLRVEAAGALGSLAPEHALGILRQGLAQLDDPELIRAVLGSLAEQPFENTRGIFETLLASEDTDAETRLAALDALALGPPQASEVLLRALRAPDANAREAAAASLGLHEGGAGVAEGLAARLPEESAPEVREAIYDALTLYGPELAAAAERDPALRRALNESAPALRIRGYRMAASWVGAGGPAGLGDVFDRQMLPWLLDWLWSAPASTSRTLALDAIQLARTPAARDALHELAASPDPGLAAAAESALEILETRP